MSISKNVKSEIVDANILSRVYKVSLLAGFIKYSSTLSLLGENNYSLVITLSNPKIARFIKEELENIFELLTTLRVYESTFKNRNTYELKVQTTMSKLNEVFTNLGILENYNDSHIISLKIPPYLLKYKNSIKGYASGIFLSKGYLAPIKKTYRLELKNLSSVELKIIKPLITKLKKYDINFKKTKNSYVIYSVEEILNFLAFVNAKESFYELSNLVISKSEKEKFNRINNVEIRNDEISFKSAEKQIKMINKLKKEKKFNSLYPEIKETYTLRLKNPYHSLSELAKIHKEKTSKSKVYRRLKNLENY